MRTLPKNLGKTLDPKVLAFRALQDVARDLEDAHSRRLEYIEMASLVGVSGTDIGRALGLKESSVRSIWDRAGQDEAIIANGKCWWCGKAEHQREGEDVVLDCERCNGIASNSYEAGYRRAAA